MADEFEKMGENLRAKTGKGLDEWVATARATGIAGHMALVNHLKSEHGLGHGYANMIVHAANASSSLSQDDEALVEAAFDGAKAHWRPLYDRLTLLVQGFGDDVELAPKKGYVSLRRKKQFALLQPSTKDRFDIGLALKGEEPAGRLELAGSWNAMVSHRVRVAAAAEIEAAHRGAVDDRDAFGTRALGQEVLEAAAVDLPGGRGQQAADAELGAGVDVHAAVAEEEAEAELADVFLVQVLAQAEHVGEVVRADLDGGLADLERALAHRMPVALDHGDAQRWIPPLQLQGQGEAGQAAP